MEVSSQFWRKCSTCKKEIPYRSSFYQCNVSTCNRKRTGLVFCSVSCFEQHLPGARHRDAYAVEETSPTREQWQSEVNETAAAAPPSSPSPAPTSGATIPRKIIPAQRASTPTAGKTSAPQEFEILVVTSKVKDYIRRRSEMSTSAGVLQVLSEQIRRLCDRAIDSARNDGRKTVMERDFENE